MTSDYFFVSFKLCPDVGTDKYIVLCNIGGRSVSGFDVIEGGPPGAPPVTGGKKIPVWKKLKEH